MSKLGNSDISASRQEASGKRTIMLPGSVFRVQNLFLLPHCLNSDPQYLTRAGSCSFLHTLICLTRVIIQPSSYDTPNHLSGILFISKRLFFNIFSVFQLFTRICLFMPSAACQDRILNEINQNLPSYTDGNSFSILQSTSPDSTFE